MPLLPPSSTASHQWSLSVSRLRAQGFNPSTMAAASPLQGQGREVGVEGAEVQGYIMYRIGAQ